MPGRTPHEAYQAFIEPLQTAISCLGTAKITVSPGGHGEVGRDHAWTLNAMRGLAFRDGLYFTAQMQYEIVTWDEEPFRVRTRGYMYTLLREGEELWAMHWHPLSRSDYSAPHFHIASVGGKAHLPGSRMTLEQAIAWVIAAGVPPARDDWEGVLAKSHALHVAHRSWPEKTGTTPTF